MQQRISPKIRYISARLRDVTWYEVVIFAVMRVSDFKMSCQITNLESKYTGLFISPSGISELDCATTKKDRAERSISIVRESLKVFFCTRGLGVLAGSTARG